MMLIAGDSAVFMYLAGGASVGEVSFVWPAVWAYASFARFVLTVVFVETSMLSFVVVLRRAAVVVSRASPVARVFPLVVVVALLTP